MPGGVAPGGEEPRWHTHGWNSDRAWRLILAIVPRVPPPLRPLLHFVTTLVCFAAMPGERAAVRRNLGRVLHGGSRRAGLADAFRLFYEFSKFMVAYIDLPPYGPGIPDGRMAGRGEARALWATIQAQGRGAVVYGMHLGQWDVALAELVRVGPRVTVVMRREDEEAARWAAAAREAAGVRVVHPGEGAFLLFDLLACLRRNEIVALHGDRVFGDRAVTVDFFGAPVGIPAGPWELAMAAGAPLLSGVVVHEGHRRYRLIFGEALDPAGIGPAAGPRHLAAHMEARIRSHPHQWFNFYDFWGTGPAPAGPARGAGDTGGATRRPAP